MAPLASAADAARERGNKAYSVKDFAAAISNYTEALILYDDDEVDGRVKALSNRAMVHDKLGGAALALADCDAALALDPTWAKARYRRVSLRAAQQDWAGVTSDGLALLGADCELKPAELTRLAVFMEEAKAALSAEAKSLGQGTVGSGDSVGGAGDNGGFADDGGPVDSDDEDSAVGLVSTLVHKLTFSPGSSDGALGGGAAAGDSGSHPALAFAAANNSDASPLAKGAIPAGGGGAREAGLCAACGKDATSLCRRCSHTVYCSRSCQQQHWKFHKAFCAQGQPDPSPKQTPRTLRGLAGLYNAGNSCYLNSAVACLSHCYPLTRHLISGQFTAELNRANDLGSKGVVTDALAALLQHLWFGSAPAVDARALKRAIDASTDSFAGLAQHDSAEFLNYVLDMVHEDLNRVTQRVYVEIPDPGARPDAEVADELWQLHTKRNDSVVTDNFSGVYKSVVTCPTCRTPWRKFDPFTTIELPLPLRATRSLRVTLVRRVAGAFPAESTAADADVTGVDGSAASGTASGTASGGSAAGGTSLTLALRAVPVVYAVEVTQQTLLRDVQAQVALLSGVAAQRLYGWEAYGGQFCQALPANFPTFKLAATDVVVFTELPSAVGATQPDDTGLLSPGRGDPAAAAGGVTERRPDGKEARDAGEDEEAGTFLCAVLHRRGPDPTRALRQSPAAARGPAEKPAYFDQPLVVTARRAWTVGALKRHLLAQLAHWFTVDPAGDTHSDGGGAAAETNTAAGSAFPPGSKDARKALVQAKLAAAQAAEARAAAAMGSLASTLKLAALDQSQVALHGFPSATQQPLADPFYHRNLESVDRLTLAEALPSVGAGGGCFLALEWDDKALTLLQAAIKVPPRVLHPSVRALAHLEEGLSLSSCFESFCKEEQMAPGEEYYCGKCKLHVRGTKAMRLAKCPEVLVLTLKRFSKQLGFAGRFLPAKLQDLVTFPVDGLDVAPYLLGPAELLRDDDAPAPGSSGFDAGGQSTVYDLFACVNHYGHANFGHYKAAVRGGEWAGGVQTAGGAPTGDVPTGAQWTRSSGRAAETPAGKTAATQPNGRVLPDLWFDYDDDTVTKIANGESVVSKAAYVLFYRRRAGGATNNAARL